MFGYITEISTGNIVSYFDLPKVPSNTNYHEFTQCLESEKPELHKETVVLYNANTLISWAMAQLFTSELIPHFAAFLDFANKANEGSKSNFLAYASAVGMTEIANTIINKAIELGANLTQES